MEQYIPKAAVVAEIERIKKEECPTNTYEGRCKLLWFEQFLSFLNTLEVKEVDLDDFGFYWGEYVDDLGGDINNYEVAKYFYELGIKAQKGE